MARSLDIETLIEDAFLTELPNYVDASATVKRWEDIKEKDLTPAVKVKATIVEEEQGTLNLFCATNVLVDFGIFTSKRSDEDGKLANSLRGEVRNLINQDNIEALLMQESGLIVYNNGVIPQTSGDVEDSRLYHKSMTVRVVATSTE
jgi:hypothetical protein